MRDEWVYRLVEGAKKKKNGEWRWVWKEGVEEEKERE